MTLFDKICITVFVLNAIINFYIIVADSIKKNEKIVKSFWDLGFFRTFFYIVPFPVTIKIIREINEKREKEALKKMKLRNE